MQINPSDTLLDEMARELGINPDDLKHSRFFNLIKGVFPVYITNLTRKLAPFGGAIESNRTVTPLVNNTVLDVHIEVPATKRWYLFGGRITNGDNVARNCYVTIQNKANENVLQLFRDQALGAGGDGYFPNSEATVIQLAGGLYPLPLSAGMAVHFHYAAGGASAGGTAIAVAWVVELDE